MDHYQNNVYESPSPVLSLTDDQCSLIDEGYWHDNDLILAAELGKALLDRNRKLELALEKSKDVEREKDAEIEFLIKEVTNLRELSQRKMEFVDEADRYNQELDISNRQLMRKISEDQQKIQRLSNTIATLEEQVAGLLERLRKYDNQSTIKETETIHSGLSSSSSTPLSTYRRHLIQKNSPVPSPMSSPKKYGNILSSTTNSINSNNNNCTDYTNTLPSFRDTRKFTNSNKAFNGSVKQKMQSKLMYRNNRHTCQYNSVSLSPGNREKGGLFFIDDELFDQPDIGAGTSGSSQQIILHKASTSSSSNLQLTYNKRYSQISSDLYGKMPWMWKMLKSKKMSEQEHTVLTRDDDNSGNVDNCASNASVLLYRTNSWPRFNEMLHNCEDYNSDSYCNLADENNNSLQSTVNHSINYNPVVANDNHSTPTPLFSKNQHSEISCNSSYTVSPSESITISNSLPVTESEVKQVAYFFSFIFQLFPTKYMISFQLQEVVID
ncbi:Cerebellar degeneration-related protein isoform 2 [Schistosoma japonicum]|uniref:Cerebellar degeneration-related protein isoform 2 n=1 Tax=Schistosoma japonicum TaxID=6182 RepID=A0A4Z2DJ90_SCHJA|nr:Cerebellar degeneration-related protein isoform 2 [Schistosoma japonicum]